MGRGKMERIWDKGGIAKCVAPPLCFLLVSGSMDINCIPGHLIGDVIHPPKRQLPFFLVVNATAFDPVPFQLHSWHNTRSTNSHHRTNLPRHELVIPKTEKLTPCLFSRGGFQNQSENSFTHLQIVGMDVITRLYVLRGKPYDLTVFPNRIMCFILQIAIL